MRFRSGATIAVTSPDELMEALKRYLQTSNESETVVASRIAAAQVSPTPAAGREHLPRSSDGNDSSNRRRQRSGLGKFFDQSMKYKGGIVDPYPSKYFS
jgi:hypothetical protein